MSSRFFSLLMAVKITMFFAACEKTDNPEIESIEIRSNEIEDKDIVAVKMVIEALKPSEGIWGISNELVSVDYKNGNLQLNFPAIISDEYLGEYFWYNSENIIPEGVTISEPKVKVVLICLIAYNREENHIGYFLLDNGEWWSAEYIYANRGFTVKGTSKHGLVFDCTFKKGWNIRYFNPLENNYQGKFTTKKPLNVNFKWRYAVNGIQ